MTGNSENKKHERFLREHLLILTLQAHCLDKKFITCCPLCQDGIVKNKDGVLLTHIFLTTSESISIVNLVFYQVFYSHELILTMSVFVCYIIRVFSSVFILMVSSLCRAWLCTHCSFSFFISLFSLSLGSLLIRPPWVFKFAGPSLNLPLHCFTMCLKYIGDLFGFLFSWNCLDLLYQHGLALISCSLINILFQTLPSTPALGPTNFFVSWHCKKHTLNVVLQIFSLHFFMIYSTFVFFCQPYW